MISLQKLQEFRKFAENIVVEAGKLLKKHQQNVKIIKYKDTQDIATSADFLAEKYLISQIKASYPNHSIFSEEAGDIKLKSDFTWIIDPLDGSKEYSRGSLEYNCLVALEYKNNLVAGAIYQVGLKSLYSCSLGDGSYFNKRKIIVNKNDSLEKSFIGHHILTSKFSSAEIDNYLRQIKAIISSCYRLRFYFDDAKALAYVASGVLDGHFIPGGTCKWVDIAPTVLLVEQAGGIVTDFFGKPIKNRDLTKGLIASNGLIHNKLLALVSKTHTKDV